MVDVEPHFDKKRNRWIGARGRVVSAPKGITAPTTRREPISSATGFRCPSGTDDKLRMPECENSKSPDRCQNSMWGKPVQYCKKTPPPPKK